MAYIMQSKPGLPNRLASMVMLTSLAFPNDCQAADWYHASESWSHEAAVFVANLSVVAAYEVKLMARFFTNTSRDTASL